MKENFNLKEYNTYKLNCNAKYFQVIKTKEKLIKVIKETTTKYKVIGNGSNLILPEVYDGLIIKLDLNEIVYYEDNVVEAGASVMLPKLAYETAKKGYKGLEWASSIPGTAGGSAVNNSGAYGSEIFDSIIKIEALKDNKIITLNKEDITYSYRETSLKETGIIILKVFFKLEVASDKELLKLIEERDLKRNASQPVKYPSAGSVFRNPEGDFAGRLVEDVGLKGFKKGGAMISDNHANFIVNINDAKTEDIIYLINLMQKKVYEKHNIKLILEQEIVS